MDMLQRAISAQHKRHVCTHYPHTTTWWLDACCILLTLSWQWLQSALPAPKTKALVDALEKIGADREEHTLLIVNQLTDTINLSARNVEKLELNTVEALSVYDVLRADKILVEQSALKYIQEFYGPKQTAATA